MDRGVVVHEVASLGKSPGNNIAIGLIDHNAFIYKAASINDPTTSPWPFVMISAPVAYQLGNGETNPYGYNVCKDRDNNLVRAVVFTSERPSSVFVELDSLPSTRTSLHVVSGLAQEAAIWEASLDTRSLTSGVHTLTVSVGTASGRVAQDTVSARFASGPCEPIPDDDAPDGGAPDGGAPDGGSPDGGSPDGGESDSGEDGSFADGSTDGSNGDGAMADGADGSINPPVSADGGGCQFGPGGSSNASWLLALLGLFARRRKS
jgi:hypothetical protein